jgi:hypothetical protein
MEKQYCKVGASHPLGSEAGGLDLLENLLSHFNRKAAEATQSGSALKEFFERKAQKIQKALQ